MQPQMMALLSIAEGTSVISETVFESRFKQAEELGGWEPRSEPKAELL